MSRLSKTLTLHYSDQLHSLAAYLLLGLGGNESPSAKDIKGLLESVGVDADDERLEKLLSELKGKDINEVRT
jgi:large subunit ribosomal protein LP2